MYYTLHAYLDVLPRHTVVSPLDMVKPYAAHLHLPNSLLPLRIPFRFNYVNSTSGVNTKWSKSPN